MGRGQPQLVLYPLQGAVHLQARMNGGERPNASNGDGARRETQGVVVEWVVRVMRVGEWVGMEEVVRRGGRRAQHGSSSSSPAVHDHVGHARDKVQRW